MLEYFLKDRGIFDEFVHNIKKVRVQHDIDDYFEEYRNNSNAIINAFIWGPRGRDKITWVEISNNWIKFRSNKKLNHEKQS